MKIKISKNLAFCIGGLVILGVFAANYYLSYCVSSNKRIESPGEFGDIFGFTNAIMTSMAFIGLIYTILLQKDELSLQREELKETRNELAGQRFELESQNKFFQRQIFENRLLNLLKYFRETRDAIKYKVHSHKIRERVAGRHFQEFSGIEVFRLHVNDMEHHAQQFSKDKVFEDFLGKIGRLEIDNRYILAGYNRAIRLIVKEILEGGNPNNDIELLKCQLDESEMVWLFYIGLNNADDNFYKTLKEHSFFGGTLDQKHIHKDVVALYERKYGI